MAKAKFSSRIGLIAATVGSAVGLGNIWRFPAETQTNGGAAFLLLYIVCVFLLGIPLMLAEFSLGRASGTDSVTAFSRLRPNSKWWLTGVLGMISSYFILCFYIVVAGWTVEYFFQSLTGDLFNGISAHASVESSNSFFTTKMEKYINSDFPPLIFTYLMILINLGVLIGGVKKGIERISMWLMPLLFLLLLTFCIISLSFPNSAEGVRFFLTPDFSKITPHALVNALGQAFFSLSLGMGTLITYGAYFPKKTKLTQTAFTVSMLDLLVAVLTGLIIFPAVSSFGLSGEDLRGSTLVFVTLPEVFAQMPAPSLWAALFFLLLMVAALTSTVSMAEVTISFVEERWKRSRRVACLIVILPLFILSTLCSLSFGSLKDWTIGGMTIFNFLDNITANYMLPIGALLISIFAGWIMPRDFMRNELRPFGAPARTIYTIIGNGVRWIVPGLILIVLISSF